MSHAAKLEDDSDSTGMWERGHVCFLTLFTEKQGAPLIPYGAIFGGNQGVDEKGKEWFTFNFQALIEYQGTTEDRKLQARVEGGRLEAIIQQLRMGRRVTIKVSGPVDDPKKPEVTALTLVELED